jgi:surface protein
MFFAAHSFNQDIGNWNVSSVTNMNIMLSGTGLSTTNYNKLLLGWSSQTLQNGVVFGGGYSTYSPGEPSSARQYIIDTYGWTITDDGVTHLPAVNTLTISEITPTSATLKYEVTHTGGSDVTTRGILWHIEPPFDNSNTGITNDGNGLGNFTSSMSDLNFGTLYYARAYAINESGIAYSPIIKFTASQRLFIEGNFTVNNKEYNGTEFADIQSNNLSLQNIVEGNSEVSLKNLSIAFNSMVVGLGKTVTITNASLVGDDAYKYYLALEGAPTATGNITPKLLYISGIDVLPKAYDGTTIATLEGDATLNGIVVSDEGQVSISSMEANYVQSTPGIMMEVNVEVTLEGEKAPNYTAEYSGVLKGIIAPKELTIGGSFTALDKDYDGTNVAEIDENNLTLVGVIGEEDVSMFNIHARFAQVEVGSNILVSLYTVAFEGNHMDNYSLSLVGAPTTTASITNPTSVIHGTLGTVKAYPNPFNNHINFEAEENITHVTIVNLTGQVILTQQLNGEQRVSVDNLPNGVYLVTVELKGGLKSVLRMVKH